MAATGMPSPPRRGRIQPSPERALQCLMTARSSAMSFLSAVESRRRERQSRVSSLPVILRPRFRWRRVIVVTRQIDRSIARIAEGLGILESYLHAWLQAAHRKDGLTV